jgi:excisionase family DNA binding protein
MQPDTNDRILAGSEAAKCLGISLSTVRRLVRDGTLWVTVMENGEVGLRDSEIQRFIHQMETPAEVVLAEPTLMSALLGTPPPLEAPPRARARKPGSGKPSSQPRQRARCHCGTCPACQDVGRWERIFQEKFADPNYYGSRTVQHSSPLSSL